MASKLEGHILITGGAGLGIFSGSFVALTFCSYSVLCSLKEFSWGETVVYGKEIGTMVTGKMSSFWKKNQDLS